MLEDDTTATIKITFDDLSYGGKYIIYAVGGLCITLTSYIGLHSISLTRKIIRDIKNNSGNYTRV